MKMVKSLLLGSAAGLVAIAGAQAADLPVKAKPVQYVKICSLYGAGFYYIPGTDTCLKVGGMVRAEVGFNAGGSFSPMFADHDSRGYDVQHWRTRAALTLDARSQTAYGTLRSFAYMSATDDYSGANTGGNTGSNNGTGASGYIRLYAPAAFIQWAGFTVGKTSSMFDFDGMGYSNQSNFWGSANGGNGIEIWAYTAQFGNGLSGTVSAENNVGRRVGVATSAGVAEGVSGETMPDIVGNLRIDQAWGSAQVMAAAHQVNFSNAADPKDKTGWAAGAGLKFNLPMLGHGDNVSGQFTYAKGAMDYVSSGMGQANTTVMGGTSSFSPGFDAVVTAAGAADLTSGWSIVGGYEHHWNPNWKTSLYGAYGEVNYTTAASAALAAQAAVVAAGVTAGSSADWNYLQVGSRTVWTPVHNLDLSVEVMYNNQGTGFAGTNIGNNDWVSGIFRVQRNF